ncbi:hypothetical protein PROFUN_07714 [Planoprotostelium fungivorum]|uniref:Short-chain dehydrogenase/reductase SDR n=1 Tax=Planoprotostelium fungivorum TaxID=1890364 RepID=A0A2P6N1C1_9EUKA|nr:hypothetical protein PROFUN_07714 [Planoprotostelium fungivorum]
MTKLNNKLVIVVGGTSGIGFAVADQCITEGARVIVASSQQQKVDKAVERLKSSHPNGDVKGHQLDLSGGPQNIETKVEAFLNTVGRFDHLVITAGTLGHAPSLKDLDLASLQSKMDIRYYAPLAFAKIISKHDLIPKGGSITLTGGTIYLRPIKNYSPTCGIIGATVALARGLALDMAPIRVNIVTPGPVHTELWDEIPAEHREPLLAGMKEKCLTGNIATPDDTAEAYLYLMKDGSATGMSIGNECGTLLT